MPDISRGGCVSDIQEVLTQPQNGDNQNGILEHDLGSSWGYRHTEWPSYLCDHRIFGKESRQWHPCMTILIQYQITAFHNVSVEIIPCVYVNSTVTYYPFKELFIGLEWLGRCTISLNINSHRICSVGSFVLVLNKEP